MKTDMPKLESLKQFEEIKQGETISVFTFSADWCPDCRFLEPFLPNLLKKYTQYHFVYVDRDQWMDLCVNLMILGIPSFVAFKNGAEIGRFVSKQRKTEAEIDAFLGGLK